MVGHAQLHYTLPQSLTRREVAAIFQSHMEWDSGARNRATALLDHLPQLVSEGSLNLPVYSESNLRDAQQQDRVLSRIHFYVGRSRRLSRRERAQESYQVLSLLKHWEKFTLQNDILYRVSRDQISKARCHQYVVPDCLKVEVLKGIRDISGHQGQF